MNKQEIINILEIEGNFHTFFYKEIKCEMKRNHTNNWCGYIYIPKWHSLFSNDEAESIDCHGGVTYCEVHNDELKVGFDTAHSGDLCPYFILNNMESFGGIYRDKYYVINEIHGMVDYVYDNYIETQRLTREMKLNELLNYEKE